MDGRTNTGPNPTGPGRAAAGVGRWLRRRGEGGEGGASSPTRTPTADRSVDRPSDRPSDRPTDRPTAERTDDRPGPDETDDATPEEPTPDVPAPTRDRPEGPEDASSDRVPESQQPSPTSKTDEADPTVTADDADGEGETVPPWVWWLLGALLLAVAVAVPLIVRGRRHAAWRGRARRSRGRDRLVRPRASPRPASRTLP